MASPGSSRDHSSGASPTGPINTDELHRLVNKALAADMAGRYAFAATYFERAAPLATQIYGDTLITAHLTLLQAQELHRQSRMEGVPSDEATSLVFSTWALVSTSVLPLLQSRIEANTLLPGRCSKKEVDYYFFFSAAMHSAECRRAMSAQEITRLSFTVGFASALKAAFATLVNLYGNRVPPSAERPAGEVFISLAIDLILPASRSLGTIRCDEEARFTGFMNFMVDHPPLQTDAFIATLRAKWKTPAMVAMRSERGLEATRLREHRDACLVRAVASHAADIAEHGLKTCAFPPCDMREATVIQYKPRVAPRGIALRSTGRCTGGSTSPRAARRWPPSRLRLRAAQQHERRGPIGRG